MGGVTVTIHDTMTPQLMAMAKRADYLLPALWRCGLIVQRSFLRQFKSGGVPRWAPLSQGTIMARRRGRGKRRKLEPRPLIDTGLLRRSYTSRAGSGSIWRTGPYWITIGSALKYAGTHQYGKPRRGPHPGVPARPLNILYPDVVLCEKAIRKWVRWGAGSG